jgi:DNA repair protein RadC
MAKKQYEAKIGESGTWYKVPSYKVMLIKDSSTEIKEPVRSPFDVKRVFMQYLEGADRENMVVAFLDRKGNLLGLNTVSVGGLHSSIVHPREVFKPAIIMGAASVILCHNHPSGDTTPSKEDIDITRRLINAGEIIGIQILDHVIVGDDNYYSLKEHGLI